MDLTTNGIVVTDVLKYVQSQMDHLNKSEKVLLQDIKFTEDNPEQHQERISSRTRTENYQ